MQQTLLCRDSEKNLGMKISCVHGSDGDLKTLTPFVDGFSTEL